MIALSWVHGINSLSATPGYEFNLALAAMSLVVVGLGAGRLSLDTVVGRHCWRANGSDEGGGAGNAQRSMVKSNDRGSTLGHHEDRQSESPATPPDHQRTRPDRPVGLPMAHLVVARLTGVNARGCRIPHPIECPSIHRVWIIDAKSRVTTLAPKTPVSVMRCHS
jgi:hypothetical protein